jgi:hypothetical protein
VDACSSPPDHGITRDWEWEQSNIDTDDMSGKKSPYDYDTKDESTSAARSGAKGIFHVRSPAAASASGADRRMDALGVSTDSTDHSTGTVDLPTISVSEDELHDTMSDISIGECDEIQELDAADEDTIGVSASVTGRCEDLRRKPPVMKKVSSNPSIATKSTIKTRVRDLSGRVKGMFAGLRRSRDNVSEVSKIIASAGPGDHPDTVTIELKQLEEIRKKEMDLKKKEEQLKKQEAANKKEEAAHRKEEEKKKSDEEKQRKAEEKRLRMEHEKLSQKEQELLRKEQENAERIAKKEQEVARKELEVTAREALLEKRLADFDRRCRELEQQAREEKAMLEREKDLIRRERISLSGAEMASRETSLSPIRPSKSENELGNDAENEPPKPPRKKYESRENLSLWTDSRRKLPPPPRPPLPIPSKKLRSCTPDPSITTSPIRSPQRIPSPQHQHEVKADISVRSAMTTTTTSSSLTTTQLMKTAPTSPALFRITPTSSSSSTLYCSDFVDMPHDDDATLRGSIERDRYDAKSFYKMIVLQWRARHPRRILKQFRPRPENRSSSSVRYGNSSPRLLYANTSSIYQNTGIYSRPVTPVIDPPPRGHYNQPSEVIYAVPHKHPVDQLRCYNYRIRRRKEFYSPHAEGEEEENPYDEIIYPIPAGNDMFPLAPPRTRRGRSRSNVAVCGDDACSRESSAARTDTDVSITVSSTEPAES